MNLVRSLVTRNPCYKNNVNAKSLYDSNTDKRYWTFQCRGPQGAMLHSVGCAQPSAKVFIDNHWNKESQTDVCVHGVIDANDGTVYQCLEWNYRGWHGGGSCNNTHIGIEMCESKYIQYTSGASFKILDKAKAQAECKRAYDSAVELFAMLAKEYGWDVDSAIVSHKEGAAKGIASNHGDPEHYWSGLGMGYTMNGFRAAVKQKMQEDIMSKDEVARLISEAVKPLGESIANLSEFLVEFIEKFPEVWEDMYARKMKSLSNNDAGEWSKKARDWAIKNGLIVGVGNLPDGTPNYAWGQPLTREQYVTVEYRRMLQEEALDGNAG